jgi:DNA-binding transcriptional ArsR family regulator
LHDDVLALAQLLACPARLAALRAIAGGGLGVTEVAHVTGVSVSTASHHLGKLLDAGMVRVRRCGRRRVYRLARRRWFVATAEGPLLAAPVRSGEAATDAAEHPITGRRPAPDSDGGVGPSTTRRTAR